MSVPYIPEMGDIVCLNPYCGSDAHVATKNREPRRA